MLASETVACMAGLVNLNLRCYTVFMARTPTYTVRLEVLIDEPLEARLNEVTKPTETRNAVIREAIEIWVTERERAAVAAAFFGERG